MCSISISATNYAPDIDAAPVKSYDINYRQQLKKGKKSTSKLESSPRENSFSEWQLPLSILSSLVLSMGRNTALAAIGAVVSLVGIADSHHKSTQRLIKEVDQRTQDRIQEMGNNSRNNIESLKEVLHTDFTHINSNLNDLKIMMLVLAGGSLVTMYKNS